MTEFKKMNKKAQKAENAKRLLGGSLIKYWK